MTEVDDTRDAAGAERGRAVAVPADRGLRVPLGLPHRRARRARRRRSTGSAFRRSTRRASSAACSTARPASSAWRRSASTIRPRVCTSRARTCSSRRGRRPSGWIVVRDALTIGPRDHEDEITPHTRPPADDDADHMLVRTIECIDGHVEMELVCEPVFDYGREPAEWSLVDDSRHTRRGRGRRADDQARVRSRARDRGGTRSRAARAQRGRARVLRAHVGRALRRAAERRRGRGEDRRDDALLAPLARPGADPRSRVARSAAAVRARDQGPDVHADRRDRRRAHDVAAGDSGRRAQLGLPLHVDARRDVHAAGAPLPQPRLGGRRVHAVRRRPRDERGRVAADHVRHRRPSRPDGVDARRPLGLRGRAAGADRQRRVRPAAERRLRRGARLVLPAHAPERAPAAPPLADRARRRRSARSPSGGTPTRGSGRRAARRSTTCRRS